MIRLDDFVVGVLACVGFWPTVAAEPDLGRLERGLSLDSPGPQEAPAAVDASVDDRWSGTYQVVPSSDQSTLPAELTLSWTEQGYRLSPPFASMQFVESMPGVLSSPAGDPDQLYLSEATFADGQKIRIIRIEGKLANGLMVSRPQPPVEADSTTIEIVPATPKLATAESMIGYVDTKIFYRLMEQKVVLRLTIGNQAEFPLKATVYVFPADATADGIDAWINNQYSDALFPETAEPSHSEEIPAERCRVVMKKLTQRSQQPFGNYQEFQVTYAIDSCENVAGFTIKPFRDSARVFVKE